MMIPTEEKEWLQDIWTIKKGNFWKHAQEKTLKPFTFYTDRFPSAFQYVDFRQYHEMAHLVMCQDKDIHDPCWGVDDFDINSSQLGTEAIELECQVMVIEEIIRSVFKRQDLWNLYDMEGNLSAWRLAKVVLDSSKDTPLERIEQLVVEAMEVWNIEKIWAELNRKYALIRSMR